MMDDVILTQNIRVFSHNWTSAAVTHTSVTKAGIILFPIEMLWESEFICSRCVCIQVLHLSIFWVVHSKTLACRCHVNKLHNSEASSCQSYRISFVQVFTFTQTTIALLEERNHPYNLTCTSCLAQGNQILPTIWMPQLLHQKVWLVRIEPAAGKTSTCIVAEKNVKCFQC